MNIEFANAFFPPNIYLNIYKLPTPLLIYMHLETNDMSMLKLEHYKESVCSFSILLESMLVPVYCCDLFLSLISCAT